MQTATAHALRGIAEVRQGLADHKKNQFAAADQDLQAALAVSPNDGTVLYYDGLALSNLMQDDAARQRFTAYAKQQKPGSMIEQRALRYVSNPELGGRAWLLRLSSPQSTASITRWMICRERRC